MRKNFIYNLILTGSNFLFPLITFPYATRVLGPHGLGICNFIISYNQTFIVIAALGIPIYGYREIAKVSNDIEKRSKLFYELLFIHLSLSILLILLYIASIFLIPSFRNYQMLALIGGVLIASNVFSLEWFFTGMSDFKFISIRNFLIKAVSVCTIFLFIKQPSDFNWYLIIYSIQFVLTAGVNIYYTRKCILKKININFNQVILHVRPIITLGIYLVMTGVYVSLPQTLLGFFHSEASVGIFYSAEKIIRMTITFFTAN
jgi:O-antigen/teichoic acid export membrane protein